jgi:hypothetical protein
MMAALHLAGQHVPRIALAVAALCISSGASAQTAATSPQTSAAKLAPASVQSAPAASTARRARRDPRTGELFDGPVETPSASPDDGLEPGIVSDGRPDEMNALMLDFMQRRQAEPAANARAGSGMSLGADSLTASIVTRTADGRLLVQCVPGESEAAHRLHAPAVNLKALRETANVK